MYVDSAYIAKFYVNEADSGEVRAVIHRADSLQSSAWAIPEVTCVLHRHVREGWLTAIQSRELAEAFLKHVEDGLWRLAPVTGHLLHRVAALVSAQPGNVYLRAGDAVHLTTAQEVGEKEIWTNDRHLLAAAPHFGLVGRSA
jgi:predicted nucleic acid-binding protein